MTSTSPTVTPPRSPRWPWACLALALIGSALIRVPLILNAGAHLDSDLAVDGLTLAEAVRGQWRWHYPGTPHMGTLPVLLSWPQAALWGANPITLVSGGLIAYEGLILAGFGLAWRAFGARVAAWSLVPLTFASTGTLWLSGRITGGHLLTVAWHAAAFAMLYACLSRGGILRAGGLGVWCGLGLYLDKMFAITVVTLVPAAVAAWWAGGRSGRGGWCAVAFLLGITLGYLPHEVGRRVDPYDAYQEQFAPLLQPAVLAWHARLLALDCLPRLVVGHRLPGLESEPSPTVLLGRWESREERAPDAVGWGTTVLGLTLFVGAIGALIAGPREPRDPAREAVRWGVLISAVLVLVGFVINRNIFGSDNYRYLVDLLVPWALGFGVLMDRLARRGWGGTLAAGGLALALAGLMTLDAARWYHRFGWIDERGLPVRPALVDPTLIWLREHPEVSSFRGEYWDVYRLSFLTGGRVRGIPIPPAPDRFPTWAAEQTESSPRIAILRHPLNPASAQLRLRFRSRGVWIYEWP